MEKIKMDRKKIERIEKKSININMKIKPSVSKYLKEKNYSPTRIFDEAVKDLMEEK